MLLSRFFRLVTTSGGGADAEECAAFFRHGVTILAAGRAIFFCVAGNAVEMIGPFDAWFVDVVDVGIVRRGDLFRKKLFFTVAFAAADNAALFGVGMTADAVGVHILLAGGVMVAILAAGKL